VYRSAKTVLILLSACLTLGAQAQQTGITLNFSAASPGSIADATGQGTGFQTRLPFTGENFTGNDPNLTLNTGSHTLTLRSTASDVNGSINLATAEFIGVPLLPYGVGATEDFLVQATFANIQYNENFDQAGIFVGIDGQSLFRGGVLFSATGRTFTVNTTPSGIGLDSGLQTIGGGLAGDTVVFAVYRISGTWFFTAINRTHPEYSGALTLAQPGFLNGSPELIGGVFAMNSANNNPKSQTVTNFYAGQIPTTSVVYSGSDSATHGAWRTTSALKPKDGDGDNIFGTDGFLIIADGTFARQPWYGAVAPVASLASPGGVNFLQIDNPLSAGTVASGLLYENSPSAVEQDFAQLVFTSFIKTRVGVLISNADVASASPANLRIRQVSGTADTGSITTPSNAQRTGDWYFFDVQARAGDAFIISGTNALPDNRNGIGAITFDSIGAALAPPPTGPTISTTGLAAGIEGSSYAFALAAAGGTPPYLWTATGLPQSLSISSSGLITGTPGQAGSFTVNVTVTDSESASDSKALRLVVGPNLVPLYVTGSGNLGTTSVGKPAGTGSFTASGGKAPYSWSLSGAPSGISLTPAGASATVSGTPQQAGIFNFGVSVSDAQGLRASAIGFVSVLGIGSPTLPNGVAFAGYSGNLPATGGAPPYRFQVTGLPPGIGIGADGTLQGTPQRDGVFTLAITVTDSAGNVASGSATLTILPAPALKISGNLPDGGLLIAYSAALNASGGGAPYVFSIAGGTLPDGIRMSNSGSFTGTPTVAGRFTFTARVTDSGGTSVSGPFSITVAPPALTITAPSPLPAGMVSFDYPAQSIQASGGIGPYTFKVTQGNPPAGISLTEVGSLSGTPTTASTSNFTVTVSDSTGLTASTPLSLQVRAFTGDLLLSQGALSFRIAAGVGSLPGPATIQVQSTDVDRTLAWSAASSVPWLTIGTTTGATPGSFNVGLNSAALSLAASGTPYAGTVTVTCGTAPCAGKTQTVAVTFLVENRPAQLSASTSSLEFKGTISDPVALAQTVTIANSGGGVLGIGSVTCGASWCHLGGQPATLAAGASADIAVTVDALTAGYYWTSLEIVTSGGKVSIPVTYRVAGNPSVTLAPSGLTVQAAIGGTVVGPANSFLVTVQDGTSVSWNATVEQGSFLRLGSTSGTATPTQPARIGFSFDAAAVAALKEGTYYGTIRVAAAGIANSPLDFTVVLVVTGASESPKPFAAPAGLVFFRGGSQSVSVYSGSPTPISFQASASTDDGGDWLAVSPAIGSTSAANAADTSVSADSSKLKPGVYRGLIHYAFASAGVRSVNVTLIVPPAAPAGLVSRAEGCTPTQIVPTQTGLVTNFSAPAAWPVTLEVALVNDCGEPVASGQVVTTFSNGDAPLGLSLADGKTGRYVATWTPRKTSAQTTITALATAKGFPSASLKFAGAVTPNKAPILNKDAVLNIYNPVGGVPAAPGTLVSIKGEYLTAVPLANTKIPLPTVLGGTSVIIGGLKAPIVAVSPGQVDVQVPAELATGQPYQVIVNANGALTTPDALQMEAASPGLSLLPTGFVNALHLAGGVVTEASPAKPGEGIVIYLAGMGLTETPVPSGEAPSAALRVANPPDITLDGLPVTYDFAGLTPGLVGVYQINMTVPEGAKNGNLKLALTQAGVPSNSGLLPVQK
jgi:uncharacterized protein (TIGR03437 family)